MGKAEAWETLQQVIGNDDPTDRFNDGVKAVVDLMTNWFDGTQLDEFLTFVKSEIIEQ